MEKVLLYITGASVLCAVSTVAKIQYHFIYEAKSWKDAQSYCRKTYTDLVTVDSAETMTILRNTVDLNKLAEAWIGLYDDVNSWRWSLSDEAFYSGYGTLYRNWPSGQPDNSDNGESCLEMLGNGEWNDIGCDVTRIPICSTVSGTAATFTVGPSPMTWAAAQSYCRTHHTDLASVRNDNENEQLKATKPDKETVWLGLFRDNWKWSNGSQVTYTYWGSAEPSGPTEYCAAANFASLGHWVDLECSLTKAFICYHEVPFTKHVIKLKLVGNSALDLNAAAVQEGLLNELRKKLKEQGVTADVRLSWKKQQDGNIFHQEKQGPPEICLLDQRLQQRPLLDTQVKGFRAKSLCTVCSGTVRQYHFIYDPKNWTEAQSYCREKYTDLVTVDSLEMVNMLNSMADISRMGSTTDAWIGLHFDVISWKWSLSDEYFYSKDENFRNWAGSEPNSLWYLKECAYMYDNGLWYDIPCQGLHGFICANISGKTI
ncbi:uncharacterized protein LOC105918719 [Fundulus heteroclitus]|uniref:uncharacterized protein LOC105918719 n=1 Tax=Fundulus heteroclitus TaxID=8078 RepID=UPI00165C7CAB|nr:uncharacterized protein LOC105918719 [Fundulus heteroclitus]